MLHLTFTGYLAGKPYCGAIKNAVDTYVHGIYAPDSVYNDKNTCPACLSIVKEIDKEIAEELE